MARPYPREFRDDVVRVARNLVKLVRDGATFEKGKLAETDSTSPTEEAA
ncbi:hypothetical protein BN978_00002 [Mycolicibacterium mageritense DSM 44476 = CIP 104973]|nr:hypothetical protein [Mycolicibacterium mageritense]CDO19555.1 hypothetical protein BN978_00002 [Mycolicibacterium mageritense DSM 44476 = CIP 104973]